MLKKIGKIKTIGTIKSLTRIKKAPAPKAIRTTKSSNVTAHLYDPRTESLTVTFGQGRVYRYDGIKPDLAADLIKAPSKGKFLHENVIGKFDHTSLPKK